jgi:hypothetical protein
LGLVEIKLKQFIHIREGLPDSYHVSILYRQVEKMKVFFLGLKALPSYLLLQQIDLFGGYRDVDSEIE